VNTTEGLQYLHATATLLTFAQEMQRQVIARHLNQVQGCQTPYENKQSQQKAYTRAFEALDYLAGFHELNKPWEHETLFEFARTIERQVESLATLQASATQQEKFTKEEKDARHRIAEAAQDGLLDVIRDIDGLLLDKIKDDECDKPIRDLGLKLADLLHLVKDLNTTADIPF
jgi:hypothetical protein